MSAHAPTDHHHVRGGPRGHGRLKLRGRAATFHGNGRRLALVLDIDETSLSNYSAINADNFTFGPNSQAEATNEIGTAIAPKRPPPPTADDLQREGFSGWTDLILKPQTSTQTTVAYKSGARAAIEQQGYRIIASVGDQYSDPGGRPRGRRVQDPQPVLLPAVESLT
jgi:hypothetical protein